MSETANGTPGDGTLDDAEQLSGGTPDDAPDDAGDDKGKLIATLQRNVAETKRLAAEREERIRQLEAEVNARNGATTPPTTGAASEIDREMAVIQKMNARIEAAANDPNHPEHEAALYERARNRAMFERLERMSLDARFSAIPDAEREGARKLFETGDYRTPEAARRAYLGSLSDEEREKLRPRPKREVPAREREEVVETSSRPLSAVGVQQRALKMGDWHREFDKASAAGDTNRMDELRRNFPRQ